MLEVWSFFFLHRIGRYGCSHHSDEGRDTAVEVWHILPLLCLLQDYFFPQKIVYGTLTVRYTLFFSTCGHDQRVLDCHVDECLCARVFCSRLNALVVLQCMRFLALFPCTWCLHVKLESEGRGAWASGAAENLSPSCQAAFKVFSSCSSGCSQPRPHPHVSRCYVTVPAGRTKGTHGDSDRHWMIQHGKTEEMSELGREGGMEKKKEDGRKDRDRDES